MRDNKKKNLSKCQISSMEKLYSDGLSLSEISIKKKISFWTVKYHLDKKYKESVVKNNYKRNKEIAKQKAKKNGK